MTTPKLTKSQREALVILATHEEPIATSTWTKSDVSSYLCYIHGGTAANLVRRKLARVVCVLPDERQVTGADLVKFLGHYERRILITDAGREALKVSR